MKRKNVVGGRGIVPAKGVPLALLMAGVKSDKVQWVERTGSISVLKVGQFERLTAGASAIVRDTDKADRVVIIPIANLNGGHVLTCG